MEINEIIKGALLSGSLISAIGAQNVFVLKQGLIKNNIFFVSLICFLCDLILMTIGIFGVGSFISGSVLATVLLAMGGCIFLLWYAYRSFKSALSFSSYIDIKEDKLSKEPLKKTIIHTLAITLLNPHVYLDTVVIVGGIGGTLSYIQKVNFLIGALFASFTWFFGLGYGARLLIPIFRKRVMWTLLDIAIGLIMTLIAIGLGRFGINKIIIG